MSGKILRFKKHKTTKTSKLKFLRLELYEDATLAHFMLLAPHAEYRFSIAPAQEVDDAFAIYETPEGDFEIVELDDFIAQDKDTLNEVLPEAREVMQEQVRVWKALDFSGRIALQLQWSNDLHEELLVRFKDMAARGNVLEMGDTLSDLLLEIECLGHYISGLDTALRCR